MKSGSIEHAMHNDLRNFRTKIVKRNRIRNLCNQLDFQIEKLNSISIINQDSGSILQFPLTLEENSKLYLSKYIGDRIENYDDEELLCHFDNHNQANEVKIYNELT